MSSSCDVDATHQWMSLSEARLLYIIPALTQGLMTSQEPLYLLYWSPWHFSGLCQFFLYISSLMTFIKGKSETLKWLSLDLILFDLLCFIRKALHGLTSSYLYTFLFNHSLTCLELQSITSSLQNISYSSRYICLPTLPSFCWDTITNP